MMYIQDTNLLITEIPTSRNIGCKDWQFHKVPCIYWSFTVYDLSCPTSAKIINKTNIWSFRCYKPHWNSQLWSLHMLFSHSERVDEIRWPCCFSCLGKPSTNVKCVSRLLGIAGFYFIYTLTLVIFYSTSSVRSLTDLCPKNHHRRPGLVEILRFLFNTFYFVLFRLNKRGFPLYGWCCFFSVYSCFVYGMHTIPLWVFPLWLFTRVCTLCIAEEEKVIKKKLKN